MQRRNWTDSGKANAIRSYVVAFLAVAAFAAGLYAVQRLFRVEIQPFLLLVPVIISAIYGGALPALFATLLALLSCTFLFLEPTLSFWVANRQDRSMVLAFAFLCLWITLMGALLERAREKAAAMMRSLQHSEHIVRALLQSASGAVVGVGPDGRISMANDATFAVFGYRPQELIGQPVELLVPNGMRKLPGAGARTTHADGRNTPAAKTREMTGKKKNGDPFPAEVTFGIADTPTGPLAVACVTDISKRKASEEQIQRAAKHDTLTALPNRALLFELAAQLLGSARRGNARAAVLYIDLDRFKAVNGTYGHTTGDKVLQEAARRIRESVRSSDLAARLGDDDFIAILSDVGTDDGVVQAASHLMARLNEPYRIGTLELLSSPSIGISIYPDDGDHLDKLIGMAETAMHRVKDQGGNAHQIFRADIDDGEKIMVALEHKMRQGLREQDFELLYQPIIDTRTMQVVSAEALIRWRQQDAAALTPDAFIGVAENSGLIHQLGDWVIREACRQHGKWRRSGLPPMRISINVSPLQFRARDFQARLKDAVEYSGIDPACVELEVTESTVMQNVQDASRILACLKEMGFHIALDDFGTGYSSLSYLSQFPIDQLKVDRRFIKQIDTDSRSLAIAETVIALGKKLGAEVVAEGIETDEALDILRKCGCGLGQGYLISEPLPPDRFVEWYRRTDPRQLFH
ncbi:putative bifunctional diguanylate cyclase/phosphodiesterase [Noviherbaspirillum sp.]|uniref:putative bifunctional diguanylate cyclase/phosphodiesterase n=1 Tax=Noviherbaspirillum sp. TaxID=1926288 RepID=UPI002FDF3390